MIDNSIKLKIDSVYKNILKNTGLQLDKAGQEKLYKIVEKRYLKNLHAYPNLIQYQHKDKK